MPGIVLFSRAFRHIRVAGGSREYAFYVALYAIVNAMPFGPLFEGAEERCGFRDWGLARTHRLLIQPIQLESHRRRRLLRACAYLVDCVECMAENPVCISNVSQTQHMKEHFVGGVELTHLQSLTCL